ncbi:MAG TPA: PASTA domain-containing protein [Ramlibacter sp.]|uniref:PASTA domain-containing protein n=1 Tax=Ramlibacter sp. TaxID=1917967 RepID=UPI002CB80477|nr:PASTA domain-containing protein [Ramlibacter sp.]HVZ44067.1 PASTA domain-containing protein [Ramlibacter sp.]
MASSAASLVAVATALAASVALAQSPERERPTRGYLMTSSCALVEPASGHCVSAGGGSALPEACTVSQVPDLVRSTYAEAGRQLAKEGLAIGPMPAQQSPGQEDIVAAQSYEPGTALWRGTQVRVYTVRRDPPAPNGNSGGEKPHSGDEKGEPERAIDRTPACPGATSTPTSTSTTTVPDLSNTMTLSEARTRLIQAGLRAVQLGGGGDAWRFAGMGPAGRTVVPRDSTVYIVGTPPAGTATASSAAAPASTPESPRCASCVAPPGSIQFVSIDSQTTAAAPSSIPAPAALIGGLAAGALAASMIRIGRRPTPPAQEEPELAPVEAPAVHATLAIQVRARHAAWELSARAGPDGDER